MPIAEDIARYEALMERLVGSYRTRMVQIFKDAELTPPQFWALSTINLLKQTKMSPLAEELGLSMGAASTLIDRLVTRGFVERTADASDRRAVHVNLSERGHQVLVTAKEAKRVLITQVFQYMDEPARTQLLSSLDSLASAWEALPPGPKGLGLGACISEE